MHHVAGILQAWLKRPLVLGGSPSIFRTASTIKTGAERLGTRLCYDLTCTSSKLCRKEDSVKGMEGLLGCPESVLVYFGDTFDLTSMFV